MFETFNTAVINFRNMVSGRISRKISNIEDVEMENIKSNQLIYERALTDFKKRIDKLEDTLRDLVRWQNQHTDGHAPGVYDADPSEVDIESRTGTVIPKGMKLIGLCKDCKHQPKVREDSCEKTGDKTFYTPDYGCIHWEKKE